MAPTIITGTASSMRIRQEEIFGPILPVEPFESLETALLEPGGQDIPLGSLRAFTRSRTNLELIRDEREVGSLLWNDCAVHFCIPDYPSSVVFRGNGLGRAHTDMPVLTFSKQRSILKLDRLDRARLFYPPLLRASSVGCRLVASLVLRKTGCRCLLRYPFDYYFLLR